MTSSTTIDIPIVEGEPYCEISLNNEVFQPVMTIKERKTFITKVYSNRNIHEYIHLFH